jgi:hypothetical protein
MGAPAFEVDPILIVDVGRTVQADAYSHIVGLQYIGPFPINEDRICADPARDLAASPVLDIEKFFLKLGEPMFGEEQWLSAMEY